MEFAVLKRKMFASVEQLSMHSVQPLLLYSAYRTLDPYGLSSSLEILLGKLKSNPAALICDSGEGAH